MKKLLGLIAIIAIGSTLTFGQKKGKEQPEKRESDKFRVDNSKLIPKLKRLALAQVSVDYKLTTTSKVITQEKSSRNMGGARVSAYLEFSDGDMTKEEYGQLSNYFYSYFQKKLKENGIDTVGWSAVTATEFYQKSADDEDTGEKESKSSNVWVTATANNGKILHHGNVGFAGGKGKRAMEFTKDLDAVMGLFEVSLDFADILLNLDIKSTEYKDLGGGWYRPSSTTMKYTWAVNPEMTIGYNDKTYPLLAPAKGWPEMLMMWKDIKSTAVYADVVTEDVSKARSTVTALFAFRKELTPVLIVTTKDRYKAAAKKTLETYVDAFLERCVKMRDK